MSSRLVLSPPQQYMLQIFMNRGVLDQFAFKSILSGILKKFNIPEGETGNDGILIFIREMNDAIKPFNIEIQKGSCDLTGYSYYCLIRLFDSFSSGKISTLYSSMELKLFRIILTLVIESEEGWVDNRTIIRHVIDEFEEYASFASTQSQIAPKVPTLREIRAALDKFINDYWIVEVSPEANTFSLHGRSLIELSQYISELFDRDTLKNCFRCKKICLIGITCRHCSCKYHRECARKVLKNQKDCISCKSTFSDEEIKGNDDDIADARSTYKKIDTSF